MKKIVVPLFAAVIGIAGALAGFNLLKEMNSGRAPLVQLVPVGEILEVRGHVTHRLPRSVNVEPLSEATELHNQERLTTGKNSSVLLQLDDGSKLRLEEDSSFIVEFDPTKEEALTATLLAGRVTPLVRGKPGALRVFQGGREIDLGETKAEVPVIGSASLPARAGETELVVVAPTPDESAVPASPSASPPTAKAAEPVAKGMGAAKLTDTLSDDEIRKFMRAQTGYFQRCYLTFMNRAGRSKAAAPAKSGVVVVGFTIQPSGKTSGASIVRSDFKDLTLQKCLLEVIERTPFRAFDGDAIPIAEFPITLE
jgi:hypothetical protein